MSTLTGLKPIGSNSSPTSHSTSGPKSTSLFRIENDDDLSNVTSTLGTLSLNSFPQPNVLNYLPKISTLSNNILPDSMLLIRVDEVPPSSPWKFPMMYKYGNNGVRYLWQIGFDGSKMVILHGPDTTTTIDTRMVETNTSGRNIYQQGYLEALAKYKNKFFTGYVQVGSSNPPMIKGMKGYPYKPGCIKRYPVLVSPKLDGTRFLGQPMGGTTVSCRSYLNRPITHLKHIEEEILALSVYLPAYITLDGELYRHGMGFHQIISATKTVKSDHPEVKLIQFNIFDTYYDLNPPAEDRYNMLISATQRLKEETGKELQSIVIVPKYIAYSHDDIVKYKNYFISLGYEGTVIQHMANGAKIGTKPYEMSRYKPGRSTHIYKYKDFIDEEGIVIGVSDAEGKESGAGLLIVQDKYNIRTRIRFGTLAERRDWLRNPSLVMGKRFTFKYYERSEDNAPIQPTGVAFRDYE